MGRWTQDFILKADDSFAGCSIETQDCMKLRYDQGLKYEEIAFARKIPIGTVKSRINRGKVQVLANRGNNATADQYKPPQEEVAGV